MSAVKISTKGQVVIPYGLREKYGFKPGVMVEIMDGEGKIVLYPKFKDPIQKGRGMLKGNDSLLEALKRSREEEKKREERYSR